ncbi:MAG: DUF3501 family protein [Thiotrichaceae bacterium]
MTTATQTSGQMSRDDLYSLEKYNEMRADYRKNIMAHKKNRQVPVGPNARLYFEDRLTMQYQIQEMLRAEKIFDGEGIQEELDTYNPMIPDGSNWKATLMLEYSDEPTRVNWLSQLLGIDKKTWVQVDSFDKVYPITNEDLERETEDKTSSVHFMRFELSAEMIAAIKKGSNISMGIEHDNYHHSVDPVAANVRDSLSGDLA